MGLSFGQKNRIFASGKHVLEKKKGMAKKNPPKRQTRKKAMLRFAQLLCEWWLGTNKNNDNTGVSGTPANSGGVP